MTKETVWMISFILGAFLLTLAAFLFIITYILNKCPKSVGRCGAKLCPAKWRRGVYEYTVNGRTYRIHEDIPSAVRKVPRCVNVVYWKAHPRFSYVDSVGSFSDYRYTLYAFVVLSVAVRPVVFCILTALGIE